MSTLRRQFLALGAIFLALASSAHAFDTGPHQDLTREALRDFGLSESAIRVAQVENWLVDYYSSSPTSALDKDLEKLHFDNLFGTERVTRYWDRLSSNTRLAVEQAARENNPLKLVALLGMSLHAVQDFYTHSNWVETHPAPSGYDYSTVTWFDTQQRDGLHTGRYPEDRPGNDELHGDYSHGLNHDSYVRPGFDRAYVFGYAASRQWVNQVRSWARGVNPAVWSAAQNLSLSPEDTRKLERDLEASYRLSEWIPFKGADGHWKGKGSGSAADFAHFAGNWIPAGDSVFVQHFKREKWHLLLCGGQGSAQDLAEDAPSILPAPVVDHISLTKRAVLIRTLSLEEDSVGVLERKIDSPGGRADFYAKVTVDGQTFVEAMQRDQPRVQPAWTTIKFVEKNQGEVAIHYELWDEDGGLAGDDDHCDINPGRGYDLDLRYSLDSRALSGTFNGIFDSEARTWEGKGNESDRAKIRLFVTTRTLDNPIPLRSFRQPKFPQATPIKRL